MAQIITRQPPPATTGGEDVYTTNPRDTTALTDDGVRGWAGAALPPAHPPSRSLAYRREAKDPRLDTRACNRCHAIRLIGAEREGGKRKNKQVIKHRRLIGRGGERATACDTPTFKHSNHPMQTCARAGAYACTAGTILCLGFILHARPRREGLPQRPYRIERCLSLPGQLNVRDGRHSRRARARLCVCVYTTG